MMAIGRRRYRLLGSVHAMADEILEVDLLAFEQGTAEQSRAVVDGLTALEGGGRGARLACKRRQP